MVWVTASPPPTIGAGALGVAIIPALLIRSDRSLVGQKKWFTPAAKPCQPCGSGSETSLEGLRRLASRRSARHRALSPPPPWFSFQSPRGGHREPQRYFANRTASLRRLLPFHRWFARNPLLPCPHRRDQAGSDRESLTRRQAPPQFNIATPRPEHPPQGKSLSAEALSCRSAEHRMIGNPIFDAELAEPAIGQNLPAPQNISRRSDGAHTRMPTRTHPDHQQTGRSRGDRCAISKGAATCAPSSDR